jgi:23S rRNA (adenine-N6)-dimethyltransferase
MVRKRIRLAQNFIWNPGLAASLVAGSGLSPQDTVYEIGPGRGIITRELAGSAKRVIAIEKDPALAARLRARFRRAGNVQIRVGDFLRLAIPEQRYRVVANIPFNITSGVVKRLLFGANPPSEAHLIVQKEAAARFCGIPVEAEVSVLAKPWFRIEKVREFRRSDFWPAPQVDVVLLHIVGREPSLVAQADATAYRRFVRLGFEAWRPDLKTAYKRVFTYAQWKRLSDDLGFAVRARPTELSFRQWLGLFDYFRTGVSEEKRATLLR